MVDIQTWQTDLSNYLLVLIIIIIIVISGHSRAINNVQQQPIRYRKTSIKSSLKKFSRHQLHRPPPLDAVSLGIDQMRFRMTSEGPRYVGRLSFKWHWPHTLPLIGQNDCILSLPTCLSLRLSIDKFSEKSRWVY